MVPAEAVRVQAPPESVQEPRAEVPTAKLTEPVAVPLLAVTVALTTTASPTTAGLGVAVTLVVVVAVPEVMVTLTVPELALNPLAPP